MKKYNLLSLLFCSICTLLLSVIAHATNPKLPLAVEITDIRIVGEPIIANLITIEVDYKSNIDGLVDISLFASKLIKLEDKKSKLKRAFHANKGVVQTEKYAAIINEYGESFINISFQMKDAPKGYKKCISKHLNIKHDSADYVVYSSLKNDVIKNSSNKKLKKQLYGKRGEESDNLRLKSTVAKSFSIHGSVKYMDYNESPERLEGLYGSKVYVWFRKSSSPNTIWHPFLGDVEHATYANINADGSFYFDFSSTADFSGYDQLLLLVSSTNRFISYSPPSAYVISTDQGSVTTFGFSEGAVFPFNTATSSTSYSSVDITINSEDGGLLRNFMLAGELVQDRYIENEPYSMPIITVNKVALDGFAGQFVSKSDGSRYIEIDPDWTDALTTCHEYGHYVTYEMWGGFDGMRNTSNQMTEGWAIFYSFAARNYANRKYSDGIQRGYDNTEEAPFNGNRFSGIRYADAGYTSYAAFACYLWSLYDGLDENFESAIYFGDNDDVVNQGRRTFEIMHFMAGKEPNDYNIRFKNGLSTSLQNSVQDIYDNMLVTNNTPMRPVQLKNANGYANDDFSVNFVWERNNYSGNPYYSNQETGYHLYQRANSSSEWLLVATISNTENTYLLNSTTANQFEYKISCYNDSGDSFNDVLVDIDCEGESIQNKTYTNNESISSCDIVIENVYIQNNSNVIFDATNKIVINGNFEAALGTTIEIK